MAVSLLLPLSAVGQTLETVTYQIGEIPPQRIWYSDLARIQFAVKADILGENPVITASIDTEDGILGTRTFDSEGSVFTYVPNPADSEEFSISFVGDKDGHPSRRPFSSHL